MTPEEAYSYRSFEHYKRETFPIISRTLAQLDGDLRVMDLACGPAVLEGIIQDGTGGRISEAWLLDFEPGFCSYAETQLKGIIPEIHASCFDMNDPDSLPKDLVGLSAVVSINALFHATPENLRKIYEYAYKVLGDGAVLMNHQTFGGRSASIVDKYCGFLDAKACLDPLDKELMRRSHIDTQLAGGPVNADAGGGYAGLPLDVSDHLTILEDIGFEAAEIWRKGKSAIILGVKQPN